MNVFDVFEKRVLKPKRMNMEYRLNMTVEIDKAKPKDESVDDVNENSLKSRIDIIAGKVKEVREELSSEQTLLRSSLQTLHSKREELLIGRIEEIERRWNRHLNTVQNQISEGLRHSDQRLLGLSLDCEAVMESQSNLTDKVQRLNQKIRSLQSATGCFTKKLMKY